VKKVKSKIREKYKKQIERVIELAKAIFIKDGSLTPIVFLLTYRGEIIPIMLPFQGDAEKDLSVDIIKAKSLEEKAIGVIFISESWALQKKEISDEEISALYAQYGSISNCPDRKEIIAVMEEYLDGTYLTRIDIVRNDKESLRLGKQEATEAGEVGGRFSNLLARLTKKELEGIEL